MYFMVPVTRKQPGGDRSATNAACKVAIDPMEPCQALPHEITPFHNHGVAQWRHPQRNCNLIRQDACSMTFLRQEIVRGR
jgi:hypothetical protein